MFSALNSATALRHALDHAAEARDRVAEGLSKLDVEAADVRIQAERAAAEAPPQPMASGARIKHSNRRALRDRRASPSLRARGLSTNGRALRARTGTGDRAPRGSPDVARGTAGGTGRLWRRAAPSGAGQRKVNQQGAIADYLEVDTGYELAVEAHLGDLLQHVIVERPEFAAAGFDIVRESGAGRCGFLSRELRPPPRRTLGTLGTPRTLRTPGPANRRLVLSSTVRDGPFAESISSVLGEAWIADSHERARVTSQQTPLPVVTMDGVVFRGPHLVSGGSREDARGILETKGEIKELREQTSRPQRALPLWRKRRPRSRARWRTRQQRLLRSRPNITSRKRPSSASRRSCSTRATKPRGWCRRTSNWHASVSTPEASATASSGVKKRRGPRSSGCRANSRPRTSA